MGVCTAFGTTPDVAVTLLAPSMRPLTMACLDVARARRVMAESRLMQTAPKETQAEIARRWKENNDGAFFRDLFAAAGRETPAMDEV